MILQQKRQHGKPNISKYTKEMKVPHHFKFKYEKIKL